MEPVSSFDLDSLPGGDPSTTSGADPVFTVGQPLVFTPSASTAMSATTAVLPVMAPDETLTPPGDRDRAQSRSASASVTATQVVLPGPVTPTARFTGTLSTDEEDEEGSVTSLRPLSRLSGPLPELSSRVTDTTSEAIRNSATPARPHLTASSSERSSSRSVSATSPEEIIRISSSSSSTANPSSRPVSLLNPDVSASASNNSPASSSVSSPPAPSVSRPPIISSSKSSSSSLPYLPTSLLAGPAAASSSTSSRSSHRVSISFAPPPSISVPSFTSLSPISSAPSAFSSAPSAEAPSGATTYASNVRAVVSGSITLTGSLAVSAIAAGASTLSDEANTTTRDQDEGKLSMMAIVGIIAGSVAGLVILGIIWYKIATRNSSKDKHEVLNEKTKPTEDDYDFTDDPVTASSSRLQRQTYLSTADGEGLFDDRYQSQYGSQSWYAGEEMVDRSFRQSHPHQLYSDYHEDQYDDDEQRTPAAPLPQHVLTEYGYGDDVRRQSNPFAPPVPLAPGSARNSTRSVRPGPSRYSRPETHFTNIYGSYESRPPMEYDRAASPHLPAKTPATSSLLPWLNQRSAAPPLPEPAVPAMQTRQPIPAMPNEAPRQKMKRSSPQRQYTQYESNAAGVGARKGAGVVMPVQPAMAKTPAGAGANTFEGVIPGFR